MEANLWFRLFVVSAVTMGISHTIARERIFAPLRDRLGGMRTWGGYFVSCPYCVSHYVAFALVPLTGTYAVRVEAFDGPLSAALTWFLSSILVTVVAAFLRVAFYFVDETQGLVRRQQKQVDVEVAAEQRLQGTAISRIAPRDEPLTTMRRRHFSLRGGRV